MRSKFIIAILVFFGSVVFAQNKPYSIEGRVGFGQSTIQNGNFNMKNVYPALSINAGVFGTWWANESTGVGTGFNLATKGAGIDSKNSDGNVTKRHSYEMVYGEIPVTGHVTFNHGKFKSHFYTGPSFNFRMYSNHRSTDKRSEYLGYESVDDKSDFRKADLSALYGFGIRSAQINNKVFFADLRVNIGVTPIGEIEQNKIYNHYYNLAVGYIF